LKTFTSILNKELYNSNNKEALILLWKDVINNLNYISGAAKIKTASIMVHNLGSCDGVFIVKGLASIISHKELNLQLDNSHDIITIKATIIMLLTIF
jgi:hypothetical protein